MLDPTTDPHLLLKCVTGLPGPTIVGFESEPDPSGESGSVALHIAPIPEDRRSAAAGLFGFTAPEEWNAAATVATGRARRLDAVPPGAQSDCDEDRRLPVSTQIVLTRQGALASSIERLSDLDGVDFGPEDLECLGEEMADGATGGAAEYGEWEDVDLTDPGRPEGLVVDAMHRVLGLPSPGLPPPPVRVALGVWTHAMLHHLFEHGDLDWATALALHPGDAVSIGSRAQRRSDTMVQPSVETVAEATLRCSDDFEWSRVHRRAASRPDPTAELHPDEASWMDTTMFARWVVGTLPDPTSLARLLEVHSPGCAHDLQQVLDRVEEVTFRSRG